MSRVKLTKEARSFINEYATKLPTLPKMVKGNPVYKKQPVDGSVLLKSGALDAQGRPGIPGVIYNADVLVYEDHRANLEWNYKMFGMAGMRVYVDGINQRYEEMQADIEKLIEEVPEEKPQLSWFQRIREFFNSPTAII